MRNRHVGSPVFDDDEGRALDALGIPAPAGAAAEHCPDPALLMAAGEGSLDAESSAAVRAHVASCETCRELAAAMAGVAEQADLDGAVERIGRRVRPPEARAPKAWMWLVPAGGLALAASVLWWFVQEPVPPSPPVAAVMAAADPIGAASVFRVDRPATDDGNLELTLRGAAAGPDSLDREISSALDLADRDGWPAAAARLEEIAAGHPRSPEALLAWGAALVGANRTADALAILERGRALAPESLASEFEWYRAIALVRSGAGGKAGPALESLCRAPGARSAVACAGRLLLRE